VERYLEKRRLKTWDNNICYNCRQKVAEERLRVKGRFIGRKKAIEMLGLTDRRNTSEIKHLLDNINRKQE
jgi:superfamily II helicase